MAKIAFLLCALVLINGKPSLPQSPADAVAFIQGFLQGIEANSAAPSQCATDLSTVISGSSQLMADILALADGNQGAFTQLVLDLQKSSKVIDPVKTDCNFHGFEGTDESRWIFDYP